MQMSRVARLPLHLVVGLLVTGLLACAQVSGRDGWKEAVCTPAFPYSGGWLGGDAAYSVSMPKAPGDGDRATLWLFGDSFVGTPGQRDRVGSSFVHNTIALSRCSEHGFLIDYYWGTNAEDEPTAFFDSGHESPYWWLFDGFTHQGVLYVGLLEIEEAPPDNPLQLPFRMTGMRLARIQNPGAPPGEWQIETSRLSDSEHAFPGASMLVMGDHAYLFAFAALGDTGQPRFLARLALRDLESFPDDLEPHLETLVEAGQWAPGFLPDRAQILMADSATEMSVEFDPRLGAWTAIYGSPIQTAEPAPRAGPHPSGSMPSPSDRVFIRTAERLEGPWEERRLLFRIPELSPEDGRPPDPNLVCYAAKGHLEFAPTAGLLLTYVCNLYTRAGEEPWPILERLTREMDLYRPRPVRVPWPAGLEDRSSAPIGHPPDP